ncbi:amidase family protein [Saccharothrix sp. HUAS TT1]|uniref:amidase family protein n=1 Tax=unclassified Saccharothrix TaxID=2593673 RepID=UPI00345B5399
MNARPDIPAHAAATTGPVGSRAVRDQAAGVDGIGLGASIAEGGLDASDVAARAVARARDPRARGVFTTVTDARAAAQARASRERHRAAAPRGPLDGVPVAYKDLFDVEGAVTTAGSRTRSANPAATADAAVVGLLTAAGAVCVGKTNLSEFAFGGLGTNPAFGTPANPHDRAEPLVPGGSSSGSAVAVATGVVPIAIGTDTSGSIRVPAAFCGVIGFKASDRRYPTAGMLPLAPTLDSVGILATSMRDVLATDRILTGPRAPHPAPPRQPLLLVPTGELLQDCAPEVRDRFHQALARLADRGARIEQHHVPVLDRAQELMDRHGTIVEAEALALHGHLLRRPPHDDSGVDPAVLRRLAGFADAARDVGPVYREMAGLRRQLRRQLGDALLACPAVRHTPPALAPLLADDALYDATNRRTLRTTMLLSYLGMPGVSLPLPPPSPVDVPGVGLLLSAPRNQDDRLLAAALDVERLLMRP